MCVRTWRLQNESRRDGPELVERGRLNLARGLRPISANLFWVFFVKTLTKSSSPQNRPHHKNVILRVGDFFDLFVFSAYQPVVFQALQQSRHPERSASQIYRVKTALVARSRRTPAVLILPMLLGAFQPPKPENRICCGTHLMVAG